MRRWTIHAFLFGVMGTLLFAAQAAPAQAKQPPSAGRLELAVTYTASRANFVPSKPFWMQGGGAEIVGHAGHGFSAVGSIIGMHSGPSPSGVPLSMMVETFGPRYTWNPSGQKSAHSVSVYGQALFGAAQGFSSTFPNVSGPASSANSLAFQAGGGVDIKLSRYMALRAGEVQWLRTGLPNSTTNVQNSLRIATGIVFKIPARK